MMKVTLGLLAVALLSALVTATVSTGKLPYYKWQDYIVQEDDYTILGQIKAFNGYRTIATND